MRFPENPLITITSKGFQQLRKIIKSKPLIDWLKLKIGETFPQNKLVDFLNEQVPSNTVKEYKENIKKNSIISLNNRAIAEIHLRIICADNKGNIWIGYTSGMVSCFNTLTKEFKHYSFIFNNNPIMGELFISDIAVDSLNIWISVHGAGLFIFNKQTEKWNKFEKLTEPFFNAVFKDKKGNIWFGSSENGLALYNKNKEIIYYKHSDKNKYSLSSNNISCIYSDNQDNLWIGCTLGDIDYAIKQKPFHYFGQGTLGNLTNINVSSVVEDENNILWIGFYNEGGLDIINKVTSKKRHISPQKNNKSALGEGTVHTLFIDSHKNLWIGTYLGGLQMFDKNNDRFITYVHNPSDSNSISGNDIRKITEDKEGNLWIAVHGAGVEKFNIQTKKFKHYRVNYLDLKYSISSDWTFSVVCDKDDNIWIGSVEGISKIEKKSPVIKHYKNQPGNEKSLSNNQVYTIFQDSNGNMWFGTTEGLNMLNPETETFRTFTKKEGLPNDNITGIIEDNKKNLWISTFKGLSRFSLTDFSVKNFDESDGLETDEFLLPGGYKNKNGEIYFGGRKGLIYIKPDEIKYNTFDPPVFITDFKLFNQSVLVGLKAGTDFHLDKQIAYTNEITLQHYQNVLTFEFKALNYILPEKNQFAYKMEGFDNQWNNIGSKHEVTYTNLPPGSYTFHVKAANNDGKWNEKGCFVKLIIRPPLWKTYWAYLIYISIVALLLVWFRYSILRREKFRSNLELERIEAKRMHDLDMMKLRFFTNITHEFRTPLTLIVGPVESLIKSVREEYMQIQLKLISRNAERLLRLINQLMDFRKLEAGGLKLEASKLDIIGFVNEIANSFSYEAKERGIDFKVESKEKEIDVWFDPDKMDKVMYNLIANAFKFTPDKGKINIFLAIKPLKLLKSEIAENNVEIIVEDTGIGISNEDLPFVFEKYYQANTPNKNIGTGIGLALTKELIELHKGTISVESSYGKGSKFIINLPVGSNHLETFQMSENELEISTELSEVKEEDSALAQKVDILETTESQSKNKLPLLLIIEDNSDLRLFIRNELSNIFNIIQTDDGIKGFDKAISNIPDIIISDVMMPGVDGIELCGKLKKDERTSHIPIILLTARIAESQILEGLETGADDYIIKPFNTALLKARAQNLIKSRRLLREQFQKQPQFTSSVVTPTSIDQEFISKVLNIINKNIPNSEFDAFQFASDIGMSRSQLYRKLQALTGFSVNELIRNCRLKKAAELLITKKYNVTETASNVGFNDLTYFIRCFSKYYGVTPSKYIFSQNSQRN